MRAAPAIALSLVACALIWKGAAASQPNPPGMFDLDGEELDVLNSDGTRTVGSTRFTVRHGSGTEEIKGETIYLNGEYDDEVERLDRQNPGSRPRLDSYEHSFHDANGSLAMIDRLDARAGIASCTNYSGGEAKVRKSRLEVPADTFAGASELMIVVGSLRQGVRPIKFHAFACVPSPGIFAVEALLPDRRERWPHYPGDLVRLDMRPDLGALNWLIAPFMPVMDAWFNPSDDWNYVGGEFDRYFRGPHVLTVRVRPKNSDTPL